MAKRAPHRDLRVTTPYLHGHDIVSAQHDLNHWADHFRLPKTSADGEWGPDSRRLARQILFLFGAKKARIVDAYTVHEQGLVSHRHYPIPGLSRAARRRSAVRRHRRHEALKREAKGPRAAIRWAMSQRGQTESPWGSNCGKRISVWERAAGVGCVPWCGVFCIKALRVAGFHALNAWVFTPTILSNARRGVNGLRYVPPSQLRAGDMVLFKWPGVSRDSCDHVGLYAGGGVTIEGNTSSGNAGSQNNGGGVYPRRRGLANVVGGARPRW